MERNVIKATLDHEVLEGSMDDILQAVKKKYSLVLFALLLIL